MKRNFSAFVLLSFAVLILVILPHPESGVADGSVCAASEDSLPFAVDVGVTSEPTTLDRSLTGRELGRIFGRPGEVCAGGVQFVFNTTLTFSYLTSRPEFGDSVCFEVSSVNVVFHYAAVTTYVASEYQEGSCEYQAILAHEQEHIRLHNEIVERHVKTIKMELASTSFLPTRDRILLAVSKERGRRTVASLLRRTFLPLSRALGSELENRNRALDTRAGYNLVRARCASQLATGRHLTEN